MRELEIYDCVIKRDPTTGQRKAETTKRKGVNKQLRAQGIDEMKAEARAILDAMGIQPRTLNVTAQHNVRAIVMSDGRRPDTTIAGRAYKRPRKTRSN